MSAEDDLAKAKALLDAFDTVEDSGHTSRSSAAARQAPIAAPKRETVREAPTVGLARTTEGVMAHEAGAESLREAPVNLGSNLVHEAPTHLGYAGEESSAPPQPQQETKSVPLPPSVPLPKKSDDE
jgi:hypothetical protein